MAAVKKVKFVSRCPNQVLCMKPARQQIIEGMAIPVPGEHIRFENGEFVTSDPKEIKYIREHRFFGNVIIEDKKAASEAEALAET
jgi:hypothetical protein